jgi:hypothetical protein
VSCVIDLPPFDTGQYEGCELLMSQGNAELTVRVCEMPAVVLKFGRVRWHRFTSIYACEPEWIGDAYFRLVEVSNSTVLAAFLRADQASTKPYSDLHHYRIVLDETGCHEFLAVSAQAL